MDPKFEEKKQPDTMKFATGLGDLDFTFDQPKPRQPEEQQPTEVADSNMSRAEELQEFFRAEGEQREQWAASADRLQAGLDRWVGGTKAAGGYLGGGKNQLKVLLASL